MADHPAALRTVGETLRQSAQLFEDLPNGRLDAEVLLAHVLSADRAELYRAPERTLSPPQSAHVEKLCRARAAGEPLAYLVGETEFWSLRLKITEDVLVPRPATETLVEHALRLADAEGYGSVIDLGTGSGAIAAALGHERKHLAITVTDYSARSLDVAKLNLRELGVDNVHCVRSDWLRPFARARVDMIVCNPPYIDQHATETFDDALRFEPAAALFAEERGMAAITQVAAAARTVLRPGGALVLEHGFDQQTAVTNLMRDLDYAAIGTARDLDGHPRICFAFTRAG